MSRKPYQIKEWNDLFLSISYEKHIDLLVVLGIIYKSSEGEEAIRDADLSGDSIILTRLMNNAESFAEAFEGIDIERLFYTYFSNKIIPNYDNQNFIIYEISDGHAFSKGISINRNDS